MVLNFVFYFLFREFSIPTINRKTEMPKIKLYYNQCNSIISDLLKFVSSFKEVFANRLFGFGFGNLNIKVNILFWAIM